MKSTKSKYCRRFLSIAALGVYVAALGTLHAADHGTSAKPDIVATAVKAGSFKTLAAALTAADLVEALQGRGPFTVLAPSDDAFAKLPAGTVESLLKPENKARLQAILKYHVISGRVPARQVAGLESTKTLSGAEVKISVVDGQLKVNDSKVVKTDIDTSNGVIHVIDTVLLPPTSGAGVKMGGAPGVIVATAIERGVPLYNSGNAEACAAIYEVAALGLADRHDVPEKARARLNKAIAQSRNQTEWSDRAWTLRTALDESRVMMN